jgi:RNA polymerase sigma-70 factor (ECF subfamily)
LIAVSNNVLRNESRTLRRYEKLLRQLPRSSPKGDLGIDLDGRLDDERVMKRVISEIKSLRIEEQEVVAMCDWAGLSYNEAATALGVPVGTVSSRISRAHVHLRGQLRPEALNAASTKDAVDEDTGSK